MAETPVYHPRSRWIGFLLRRCVTPVMRCFNDRIAEFGLNHRQYHILYLARSQRYNQNSLASEIGTTQNTTGELIKELADRKLVSQRPNPQNRREKIIALTQEGIKFFALVEAVTAATQAQLLSVLSAAEQEELIRLLQKFAISLGESIK